MKVAALSPSTPMKTSTKAMAKEALSPHDITSSSSHSVHGCVSSRPNTTLPSPPVHTGRLDKVLDFLGRLLVVLGLLPGGIGGPKHSFMSIVKICLVVLTVGFLGSAYIVIRCYVMSNNIMDYDSTLLASELFYACCLSATGWLTAGSFWLRSRDVVLLLNQFRQLDSDVTYRWLWIAKAVVSILPFVFDGFLYTYMDTEDIDQRLPLSWTCIHGASFLWLIFVASVPVMWYVFLAQLVHASLCTNNITLAQAAAAAGGRQTAMLMRIHTQNLTLRRLYGEIEEALSIPLLCSYIIITFSIISSVSYILIQSNENIWNYATIVLIFLKMVTIVILGLTADKVTAAAAAPKLLLSQAVLHKPANLRHFPLSTEAQEQVVINRLAEVPLTFSLGGIYVLSVSNISTLLSASSTYIIVLLQFSNICKTCGAAARRGR